MFNEPIEEVYFGWLYSKVAYTENPTPSLTYYTLLRDLHATEFAYILTGDDNRAEDGLDLRREFVREAMLPNEPPELSRHIPCSVLEMLIAFARRINFDDDSRTPREWFWVFMENLGLRDLSDSYPGVSERVYQVMEQFVWRTYSFSGNGGGLFPLRQPEQDQTRVELYYQFCAWLVEQERLHG